jgi:hypothetical protein
MSRSPTTFRQRDVAAAIRAAKQAGIEVARIEIDQNGRIVLVAKGGDGDPAPALSNEWDVVFSEKEGTC